MRILIVGGYAHVVGGAQEYLRALIPRIAADGHSIAYAYGVPIAPDAELVVSRPDVPMFDASAQRTQSALREIDRWRPEVVYANSQNNAALEDALLDRYPTAMFAHDYYGTCATGRKRFAFPSIQPCTRKFGPLCLAMHYPRRCGGLSPVSLAHHYLIQRARNRNLPRYGAVLVASRHMEAEFLRAGVSSNRVKRIGLPLPAGVRAATVPPTHPIRGRILMLARLVADKGADYLIRAIPIAQRAAGRRLHLTIAGDGPERARVAALAERLDVECRFTGWVDAAARDNLLRESDLIAIPSLWPEPYGMTGIEAGAQGVPAVAFDSGGVRDWLIPDSTGVLADANPPTAKGFAAAIARAFGSEDFYAALRRSAWEFSSRFDMDLHWTALGGVLSAVTRDTGR
jgi:glycosyltransferase involved in cell wall biosynthesis